MENNGERKREKLALSIAGVCIMTIAAMLIVVSLKPMGEEPLVPMGEFVAREDMPETSDDRQSANDSSVLDEGFAAQGDEPVHVNTFIEVKGIYSDSAYVETYERRLDEAGNVIEFTYVGEDADLDRVHAEMAYDEYGVPTACSGDESWTQTVVEKDAAGRPLKVERVRPSGDTTVFNFVYYDDGTPRWYSIEMPEESRYFTLDENGRITSYLIEADDTALTYDVAYGGLEGQPTSSERVDMWGEVDERAAFHYDEEGQIVERDTQCGGSGSSVERYAYEEISNPSDMVRIWSRVFCRNNPLSHPTF